VNYSEKPKKTGPIGYGRNDVKPGKCDVRLSEDEMATLNRLSDTYGVTKSDIMRNALKLFSRELEEK
jgi:hypothetical protein